MNASLKIATSPARSEIAASGLLGDLHSPYFGARCPRFHGNARHKLSPHRRPLDLILNPATRPARRQRNVTGLWREMRVEAICRSPQKMSDHPSCHVWHTFFTSRVLSPQNRSTLRCRRAGWVAAQAKSKRSNLPPRPPPHQRRYRLRRVDLPIQQRNNRRRNRHLDPKALRALDDRAGAVHALRDVA